MVKIWKKMSENRLTEEFILTESIIARTATIILIIINEARLPLCGVEEKTRDIAIISKIIMTGILITWIIFNQANFKITKKENQQLNGMKLTTRMPVRIYLNTTIIKMMK